MKTDFEIDKIYRKGEEIFIVREIWNADESNHPVKITWTVGPRKSWDDSLRLDDFALKVTKETDPEYFL